MNNRAPVSLGPVNHPAPPITQAELQYHESKYKLARQLARECAELRQEFIARLDAGAGVEDGPRGAEDREASRRRLTAKKLVRLYGEEWVEDLMESIEPTVSRTLVITGSEDRRRSRGHRSR